MEGISVSEFADKVDEDTSSVVDVVVERGWRFGIEKLAHGFEITLGGMIAGPLPMYQARSMTKANVGLSGTKGLLRTIGADPSSMEELQAQVDGLNIGLENIGGLDPDAAMIRAYDHGPHRIIGGLVSRTYAPVSHHQLLEGIIASPAFQDAQVVKWKADESRIDAMILLAGSEWKVDGGMSAGIKIHNGQFGDRSYGFIAMLFRLLCGNGMMDVFLKEVSSKRHIDVHLDVSADAAEVAGRVGNMKLLCDNAMGDELDVIDGLVELHRRALLPRGPLRIALERRHDLGGGGDGSQSRWAMGQAIAASARGYKIAQSEDLSRLAGRVILEGMEPIRRSHPIPNNAPSRADVWEEFIGAAPDWAE